MAQGIGGSVLAWGQTHVFFELTGEVIAVVETAIKGNLGNMSTTLPQKDARALDPLAENPCKWRCSRGGMEHPEEAPSRHVGDLGQFVQIQVLLDIAFQVGNRLANPQQRAAVGGRAAAIAP